MNAPLPPSDPFVPFEASPPDPWDLGKVNHLLRRLGLGPSAELSKTLLPLSPASAVQTLLDYDPAKDPLNDLLDRMVGFFNFKMIDEVQGWCYFRMLNTPHPAQERMMLFWHNRFATSASKVDQPRQMHGQMELFRRMGLGNFRELLRAVGRDPAMLVWLDGQTNRKGHPNENYGREVMELFTLGIGNYTEKDVQQLARAMTGWGIGTTGGVFNPKAWDEGDKEIFGQTGKFNADSAVELLLKHPAAPKYLATKILKEFVHPDPVPEHIDYYAGRLIFHDWEIKPVLTELFTSRLFYSAWAYRSRIKSPMELVVGAVLALGGKANTDYINKVTARMGQSILFPPNVKGWDGNEAWINSNTVLVRFNFGLSMAMERSGEFARRPDLETELKTANASSASLVVDYYANVLLDGQIRPELRQRLIDFLNTAADGKPRPFVLNHETFTNRVRDMIHLMMATPECQLA